MMISFDFLNKPINLDDDKINVLCIENRQVFRRISSVFFEGTWEDSGICVFENYTPIKAKNITEVIFNYFALNLSSASIKKMFQQLSDFCNKEMREETERLHSEILTFMDKLCQNFEYDYDYDDELDLPSFFKSQSLHLNISSEDLLTGLLDYILLTHKYCSKKLFVLFSPHLYFTKEELNKLYTDILSRNLKILVIEADKSFANMEKETYRILDADLCEIY